MLPWVVFTFKSIKFDRDIVCQWGRGISDKDRLMVVFNPNRFRMEKKVEFSNAQIEEILQWYRVGVKKSMKSSFVILIAWGTFYILFFGI